VAQEKDRLQPTKPESQHKPKPAVAETPYTSTLKNLTTAQEPCRALRLRARQNKDQRRRKIGFCTELETVRLERRTRFGRDRSLAREQGKKLGRRALAEPGLRQRLLTDKSRTWAAKQKLPTAYSCGPENRRGAPSRENLAKEISPATKKRDRAVRLQSEALQTKKLTLWFPLPPRLLKTIKRKIAATRRKTAVTCSSFRWKELNSDARTGEQRPGPAALLLVSHARTEVSLWRRQGSQIRPILKEFDDWWNGMESAQFEF
jgi:hypothetical protein